MLVSNMKKLRCLKVSTTSFDERPNFFLSNELRYIDWKGYPASLFHESFQPTRLAVLKMKRSLQKELWKGYKYLPCLKEMKLSDMKALVRTPDFGGLQCLQKLTLDTCENLEDIHQSLGSLSSLVHLSVEKCDKLTRFPTIVKMDKLKSLDISQCKALTEFPKIEANMDNLVTLRLDNVGKQVLLSSVGEYCTKLTLMRLHSCSKLKKIDGNFYALKGLQTFKLLDCKQFEKLTNNLFNENLDGLSLSLDNSSFEQLIPSSMPHFLRKLDLSKCGLKDGEIPDEIGELFNLRELDLRGNDFTQLDFSLLPLTRLKLLGLGDCINLVELPELPSKLANFSADGCVSLEVVKDDVHRRCKWLCEVSIGGWRKSITGGERLLETMLEGKAAKSGCVILQLSGLEIPRGFEPRLVRGERCRMQLPENWYIHFSGFLFCAISDGDYIGCPNISLKHAEKSVGGSWMGIQDDDHIGRKPNSSLVATNTCKFG